MTTAKHVEPLPPWDDRRDAIRVGEVAMFLKRKYNLTVARRTVNSWIKDGVPSSSIDGGRIYLATTRFAGQAYVKKSDLEAFCAAE